MRSTLNTNVITGLDMCRSSRLRSTWNTNVITGLDMFQVWPKNSKNEALFSQIWTWVTSLTKTKTLLPVGRMLSLGPWPRVLPKPYETMFIMHKNKRLLWGVHGQKRARPRTRKEQPGTTKLTRMQNHAECTQERKHKMLVQWQMTCQAFCSRGLRSKRANQAKVTQQKQVPRRNCLIDWL